MPDCSLVYSYFALILFRQQPLTSNNRGKVKENIKVDCTETSLISILAISPKHICICTYELHFAKILWQYCTLLHCLLENSLFSFTIKSNIPINFCALDFSALPLVQCSLLVHSAELASACSLDYSQGKCNGGRMEVWRDLAVKAGKANTRAATTKVWWTK